MFKLLRLIRFLNPKTSVKVNYFRRQEVTFHKHLFLKHLILANQLLAAPKIDHKYDKIYSLH